MASQTRDNIKKKRIIKRKRRQVKIFRLIIFLFILAILGTGVLFAFFAFYNWGSQLYGEYAARYDGYTQRRTEITADIGDERFDNYTNVLVLGLDEGVNLENTPEQRADTIILLSLDNESGRVRFISIPSGTLIKVPGSDQMDKASAIYAHGGAPVMMRAIADLLNVSVHHYLTLDTKAFAEFIDVLGGIDIYVENDMDYDDPVAGLSIRIAKGYQHMDGETALKYLRYRGGDLGDVGRVQRQQRFIKAMYEQILHIDTVAKLPTIAEIFQANMDTSAEIFDSAHLANVLRSLRRETPWTMMLPGDVSEQDESLWLPDKGAIEVRMQELFPIIENDPAEETAADT